VSRQEKFPRPVSRWSTFRLTVTLRLSRSWTHWRQSRADKKLVREVKRLRQLEELVEYQLARVHRAEARAHPLQMVPTPVTDRLEQEMQQEHLRQMARPKVTPEPEPEPTPEPTPEELEPMPDPLVEISQRIGLPTQPR
jgi:L-lysine 2,3-aminomutase